MFSFRVCVVSGSLENRTQHNAVISRVWTTSPRLPCLSRAPRSRTETLLLPKQACFHLHLCPIVSSPCGSRTQPARLEKPMTSPEVERAVLCAYAERQVGREALESSSAVLQTAARPSQLPAHVVVRARKNPMPCDTGLRLIPFGIDQVSQAQRHRGQRICRLIIGKRPCAFMFAGET